MKCISLPFRLSDSYNFPASLTSRFRKTVHNGSFLKLYIPSTLKFDRKAEIPPLTPFTSVLHKEQSAATVCIRQHSLAETEDSLGKTNMADMGRRLSCLLLLLLLYLWEAGGDKLDHKDGKGLPPSKTKPPFFQKVKQKEEEPSSSKHFLFI